MAANLSQSITPELTNIQPSSGPMSGGSEGFPVSSTADAQRFSQALAIHREAQGAAHQTNAANEVGSVGHSKSIGSQMMAGLSDMSARLKSDHKQVSNLIEKATVGGDDNLMMKAMLALTDYQQRVQIVSKVVSKAATSMDSLTRLQ
jgi:Type III secretion basal body protein I, YscI, HrpB, PscI